MMKKLLYIFLLFNIYSWSQTADLVVIKTDGSNTFTPGQTLTYTITITNNGPDDAVNVVVEDLVPAGIDPLTVSWSGNNGSSGNGDLLDNLPLIQVAEIFTYEVIIPIPSNFDQTADFVNVVSVTSDTTDPDPDCPGCTDVNLPNPLANLVTVKTNNRTQWIRNEPTTYTITITNNGPSDAFNVVVSDPLPAGIIQMTWTGPNDTSGEGPLLETVPIIENGQTVVFQVTIFIPQTYNLTSNIVNTVTITSDTPDPLPACPQCTDTDTPAPRFVTVNTNSFTVPQLVQDVLINSGCANVSNFTSSNTPGCTPIGYFKKNNSNFPFNEGVIIRTGNANFTQGHYSGNNLGDDCPSNSSDPGLVALAQSQGQNSGIFNAAFIQFNFTPLTDNFSFNFLFASNEYGTFQCTFGDVFAFFLTNLDTGVTTNLAVVPGTTTPVSVTTIRDEANNAGCGSVNPEFFGLFNQTLPLLDTAINMRGQTVVLNASSAVIPNNNYTIRLVIGDYIDTIFDSAVFIEGGSFDVGTAGISGTSGFENFGEFTIENGGALCPGGCKVIQAGSSPIAIATYEWTFNGVVIPGATDYQLEVCNPGTYGVTVTIGGATGCQQIDQSIVESFDLPDINVDDIDLTSCDFFNLNENTPIILDGLFGEISYHNTQQDAANAANPIPNAANYPGINGEIIYAAVQIDGEDCISAVSFSLIVPVCGLDPQPTDIPALCDTDGDGFEVFDLTLAETNALNGLPAADHNITYHNSQADADLGISPIGAPGSYSGINGEQIYIRVEQIADPTVYGVTVITLTVIDPPVLPDFVDIEICDEYILPALTEGNYFDGPGGTGTAYNAGDSITATTLIYVYAETGTTPNCTDEKTFTITINETPIPDQPDEVEACDSYVLPALSVGNYFDGPGATGTAYNAGDTVLATTLMYVYAETGTTPNCTAESTFTITINETPTPDQPNDVEACDEYILPALTTGNYFDGPDGTGTAYNAGDAITATTLMYVYAETGTTPNCAAENTFTITINETPTPDQPDDVEACDSYVLPALTIGNYYDGPGATGTTYNAGDTILATTLMYVYAETGTTPNCTAENTFTITINETPIPDQPDDVEACDEYILPALTTGNYFDGPDGTGTAYFAGDAITATTLMYVYAETGTTPNCTAENTFTITINQTPTPDQPEDVTACQEYELPELTIGNYYSGPGATGIAYNQGDLITTTTTLYVYAETGTTPNCAAENTFTINIVAPPIIGDPDPIRVCDDNNDGFATFDLSLSLGQITLGQPGLTVTFHQTQTDAELGVNEIPNPTTFNNNNQATQIIYVRVVQSGAPDCSAQTTLTLIVDPRPVLNDSIATYALCDQNNGGDGIEVFDLTSWYDAITQQAGLTLSFAYEESGVLIPIGNPAAFSNTVPFGQTITVTAENSFGCQWSGTFAIEVLPLPTVTLPADLTACSDGITPGVADFDLTVRNLEITSGVPGLLVSYHLTQNQADNNQGALTMPYSGADGQVLFVRVENAQTGCYDTTTLTLIVNEGPVANTPTPLTYCDPNNDNVGIFDLTQVELQVTGGAVNSQVSYHETLTDAELGTNAISVPSNYSSLASVTGEQIIYIRVQSTVTDCVSIVELLLIVNPTPVIADPADVIPLEVCDDDTDGIGAFDLTLSIDNILNGLDPSLHTVTFHSSEATAEAGTNPIANILNYANTTPNTEILWVRVTITATGCFKVVPLTLIVNELPPVAFPILTYELCETGLQDEIEIFNIREYAEAQVNNPAWSLSFYFSQADAQADQNPLPDQYQNQSNPQTIWVVVTNNQTGCQSTTVMDLLVNPRPQLLLPLNGLTQCDTNGEGFGSFDLLDEIDSLLNGATGITVSFHSTQTDAELGVNLLANPYNNTLAYQEFVYIRAVDDLTGCISTFMLTLNVNPSPLMPELANLTQCDQDNNPQSGTTAFDLTQQNAVILAAQPQGLGNYTIRYFTSEDNAQNNTSAIVTPQSFINTTNPQTIWVRVQNTTTGCFTLGSFTLTVDLPENLPVSMGTYPLCDPDNDGFMVFDLPGRVEQAITGGQTGFTITYYPSLASAQAGTNAIDNPDQYQNTQPAAQTIGIEVINGQGCRTITTLTLLVLPTPVVVNPPLLEACDDNNAGDLEEEFDLTTHQNLISGGDPNLTFAYYPTQEDAINDTNEIISPADYNSATGSIWIKVMNQQQTAPGEFCYTLVEQFLEVHPLPQINDTIEDFVQCTVGSVPAVFDLGSWIDEITDEEGLTVSFHLTQADAISGSNTLPNNYTNTSNPQEIWVRLVNPQTDCVSTGSFNLVIEEGAEANPVSPSEDGLTVCDEDGTNDGQTSFDLTPFGAIVLGAQDPTQYEVSYYESLADAQAMQNAITNPASYVNTTAFSQDIYIRVTNISTTTQCFEFSMITLIVNPLPELTLNDGFICINLSTGVAIAPYTIVSNINDPQDYIFEWTFNGDVIVGATDSTYTTTQSGIYGVTATNTATGCSMLQPEFMLLQETSAAEIVQIIVDGAFSQNQTVTVIVSGLGDYEYQFNDGPFQNSNIFTNVPPGEFEITVRDKNNGGCDVVTQTGTAINYPNFFTPNADGYNDTWNIIGMEDPVYNAKIYIFDRYGKLLKQISPRGLGWDGAYNGQPMPSTDYWFTVTYEENGNPKEFRAHFSLKR